MNQSFQYELQLSKRDGAPLLATEGQPFGPIPVQVDFAPAREWAYFEAVCRGTDTGDLAVAGPEPVWDESLGEPYLSGFSMNVGRNGDAFHVALPTTYFAELARDLSAVFVKGGQLQPGELFNYLVTARRGDPPDVSPSGIGGGLKVRRKAAELTIHEGPALGNVLADATVHGAIADDELPVFIPQPVLGQIESQTIAAGANETGSFLLGRLYRCPETREVFLMVTGQIPAEHTTQELMSLSFSAESFDTARRTVRDRGQGELICGWAHSHSWFHETCQNCTKAVGEGCGVTADFFSDDDVRVHRTAFLRAFSVGLVISSSPCSGIVHALYGWRLGMVTRRRGFYVVQDKREKEEA